MDREPVQGSQGRQTHGGLIGPRMDHATGIGGLIGRIPYRMAFAGGWIDQPFVSRNNPEPAGSMVVVAIEPDFRWMDRCGMATSTRAVATRQLMKTYVYVQLLLPFNVLVHI